MVQKYKHDFIQFVLDTKALCFGDYQLKSGRRSPYFYNAGIFNDGQALAKLSNFYAEAIQNAEFKYDVLFGPAYKGIPLACTTVTTLAEKYQIKVPYAFNRKEKKAHGEGGQIVGHPIENKRLLIIDDVITAGTAIRETMTLIETYQASLAGVVISIDRQERSHGDISTLQAIRNQYQVPVVAIVSINDIVSYLKEHGGYTQEVTAIETYLKTYGA